jgi:hypothetical protein
MARAHDDDRPVRMTKGMEKAIRAAQGKRRRLILGVGIGAVVLLVGLTALGVYWFTPPPPPTESPQAAFDDFQAAVAANDHGRVYDRLHPDSYDMLGAQIQASMVLDPEMKPHREKRGRELWIAYCQEQQKKGSTTYGLMDRWRTPAAVESVQEDGDTAMLTVRTQDGRTESVRMKKHNGEWRYRSTFFGH